MPAKTRGASEVGRLFRHQVVVRYMRSVVFRNLFHTVTSLRRLVKIPVFQRRLFGIVGWRSEALVVRFIVIAVVFDVALASQT